MPLREFGQPKGGLYFGGVRLRIVVLAIGAGVIYVPVLRTFANLEPRKAIGTSLHFMMIVVPVAIFAHLIQTIWAYLIQAI